jgi:hypothetical protein
MVFSPGRSSSEVAKRHPRLTISNWSIAWKSWHLVLTLFAEVPVHRREGDDILQTLELTGDQSAMG